MTKAGKEPIAMSPLTIVNYRIARDTANAIKESARATPDGKEITATSVNICFLSVFAIPANRRIQ